MVRLLENEDSLTDFEKVPGSDVGVAFPPGANTLMKLNVPTGPEEARKADAADVDVLGEGADKSADVSATIETCDPMHMASDPQKSGNSFHTFIYNCKTEQMTKIKGDSNPSVATVDIDPFSNLQGMALDPQRNKLYLLDNIDDGPVIIDVNTGRNRALTNKRIQEAKRFALAKIVGEHANLRCVAFNPQNRGVYFLNASTEEIVELNFKGKLIAVQNIADSGFDFTDLKGCIFAPSSDRTDDPSQFNFFTANGGSDLGEVIEWSLN